MAWTESSPPPRRRSDMQATAEPAPAPNGSRPPTGAQTDADGHMIFSPSLVFDTGVIEFKLVRPIGEGTFGKVFAALERPSRISSQPTGEERMVAIKVIRAIDKYWDAAQVELSILQRIAEACEPDQDLPIALLRHSFAINHHMCMVFKLYGPNLYDVLGRSNFEPMLENDVREIGAQCLEAIQFLHRNQITHTDLKPENILLETPPGFDHANNGAPNLRRYNTRIKVIDLGSATLDWDHHSAVVSTRQYRAPEVILDQGWSHAIDVWSLGCILVELWTGRALFQTHQNTEHLALMERVLGQIPPRLLRKNTKYGTQDGLLKWPERARSDESLQFVNNAAPLAAILRLADPTRSELRYHQLLDLVRRMLDYHPGRRILASEALCQDFFQGMPVAAALLVRGTPVPTTVSPVGLAVGLPLPAGAGAAIVPPVVAPALARTRPVVTPQPPPFFPPKSAFVFSADHSRPRPFVPANGLAPNRGVSPPLPTFGGGGAGGVAAGVNHNANNNNNNNTSAVSSRKAERPEREPGRKRPHRSRRDEAGERFAESNNGLLHATTLPTMAGSPSDMVEGVSSNGVGGGGGAGVGSSSLRRVVRE